MTFGYSTLELIYDDRFTKEEKLSIYNSHIEELNSIESLYRGMILAVMTKYIMKIIKRYNNGN